MRVSPLQRVHAACMAIIQTTTMVVYSLQSVLALVSYIATDLFQHLPFSMVSCNPHHGAVSKVTCDCAALFLNFP